MKLQSMSNKSTDDDVEEISANMIQDRHEVTHLKMYLKWKGKDEKKYLVKYLYLCNLGNPLVYCLLKVPTTKLNQYCVEQQILLSL